MQLGFMEYAALAASLLGKKGGGGGGDGGQNVNVGVSTNVTTQVNPQISPVFVQQSGATNSPVKTGYTTAIPNTVPATGAIPGFDDGIPLPFGERASPIIPLVLGAGLLFFILAKRGGKSRGR